MDMTDTAVSRPSHLRWETRANPACLESVFTISYRVGHSKRQPTRRKLRIQVKRYRLPRPAFGAVFSWADQPGPTYTSSELKTSPEAAMRFAAQEVVTAVHSIISQEKTNAKRSLLRGLAQAAAGQTETLEGAS